MSFFAELKRRNVFRVGIAYAVGAWLLLQLTDVLSELLNLPDTIGPVVVAIVAIGLPIVLFAAWAFEMTPEGIKREKDVDRSESITAQTGQKLNRTIIVILTVAVGFLLVDKFYLSSGDERPIAEIKPSIAVLPRHPAATIQIRAGIVACRHQRLLRDAPRAPCSAG